MGEEAGQIGNTAFGLQSIRVSHLFKALRSKIQNVSCKYARIRQGRWIESIGFWVCWFGFVELWDAVGVYFEPGPRFELLWFAGCSVAVCFSYQVERLRLPEASAMPLLQLPANVELRFEGRKVRHAESLGLCMLQLNADAKNIQNQCLDHFGFNACTVWM